MSIDKNDIEKYIFDPQNPKQCKSYKLLLRIATRDNSSFFSPDFLQYLFGDEILNDKFKDEFYDLPDDYETLSFNEKVELYRKQLSESDLDDFKKEIHVNKIRINKITQYSFFKNLVDFIFDYRDMKNRVFNKILIDIDIKELGSFIKKTIFYNETKFNSSIKCKEIEYDKHFIIFSKNILNILKNDIRKSSIIITMESNIDKFLEYTDNQNVKPIFLKKIEDVDLLLNILEQDITKEKNKDIEKEEILIIKDIKIENFFSIKKLKLDNLEDKKEIYILGENGDGKTLLLQAIAIALKGTQKDGQEKFREIKDEFNLNIQDTSGNIFNADETNIYKNMFAYGANRNNNCQSNKDEAGYLTLFDNSLDLKDPISWLTNLEHSELRGDINVLSLNEAKSMIQSLLNRDVVIDIISPTEITFTEKGSPVEFDSLSAGYKGVITIICDMLVRLSENQPYITDIKDYEGIVLIDEVELHLHPKWKYNFVNNLRETFPLIQFIFTTHSPTVILGASKGAVFYKIYKEDGEVCISDQIENEGYTNNSLISSPLFDLETIASRDFDNKNISSDDYIYSKIHKVVAQKIKSDININEDEILKLIDEELDKL